MMRMKSSAQNGNDATSGVAYGDVGYIISGIKTSKEVKVGDTITHIARPCEEAIAGFEEVKPMVFAGVPHRGRRF